MFFGLSQILFHGIMMNMKLKSLYNPGFAACVCLHGPIGIYYIWYVASNRLAGASDYIFGIIAMIVVAALIVLLPVKVFSTRNAKYPFSKEEMERFDMVEKAKKLGNSKRFIFFKK